MAVEWAVSNSGTVVDEVVLLLITLKCVWGRGLLRPGVGLGGAKPPPQGFEAFFRKNYHAVAVLAAVGEDSS